MAYPGPDVVPSKGRGWGMTSSVPGPVPTRGEGGAYHLQIQVFLSSGGRDGGMPSPAPCLLFMGQGLGHEIFSSGPCTTRE